jgi:hypothetical protein
MIWHAYGLPCTSACLPAVYRPGLKLKDDVVAGTNLGDIVWHDRELNEMLYHYVYSVLELRHEMMQAGLAVKVVNHWLARHVVLIGTKR